MPCYFYAECEIRTVVCLPNKYKSMDRLMALLLACTLVSENIWKTEITVCVCVCIILSCKHNEPNCLPSLSSHSLEFMQVGSKCCFSTNPEITTEKGNIVSIVTACWVLITLKVVSFAYIFLCRDAV